MSPADGQAGKHAVVIGGGMAGSLAARVLAERFTRVTVVDQDRFPEEPVHRKGVPQSRHIHILLARGQRELEGLFPGLDAELGEAGAAPLDWLADFRWLNFAGWKPRFPSQLRTHGCSRELLEWAIQRRLRAYPNIQFLEGCEVVDLLFDASRGTVTGASIKARDADEVDRREVHADLVVDASGRSSRASQWLEALGYQSPRETVINSFIGYATRRYRRPAGFQGDWKGLYLQVSPPSVGRGGIIYPIEHGNWIVTLVGVARDYPPTDEAGFLEYARSLPDPSLYRAIQDAKPLTPVYGYRRLENRWRHYEKLSRMPRRFIVIGDAVCALNPVYGQGMTVAALGAQVLARHFRMPGRNGSGGIPPDLQRKLTSVYTTPWLLATGEDFRVPEVEGGRPGPFVRLLHRYMDEVMVVAANQPAVHLTFVEVLSLLRSPAALFHPRIAAQVLARMAARSH